MDNNPLTPRASSFSIASLITSDCCDDENSFYHSMTSPTGTNINLNDFSTEKIPTDYYPISIEQDFRSSTLTETNHGQYQQQIKSKDNRSKRLTKTRIMEG
jgi:hypothetical protein